MAIADAFDMEYPVKCDLQHIHENAVKVHMITDSLYLFDVLTGNQVTIIKTND